MAFKYHLNEDNLSSLKTGDVILGSTFPILFLFSDFFGFIVTCIEKYAFRYKRSHVAIAVIIDGKQLIWESSINLHGDVETGFDSGCKLVDLKSRIKEYPGEVWARRLILDNEDQDRVEMEEKLEEVIAKYRGKPFENSIMEMLKAHYDGPGGDNQTNEANLFCSELIAATYQHLGLLDFPPHGRPSNEYTPRDFSIVDTNGDKAELNNASFSEEFPIKIKKRWLR